MSLLDLQTPLYVSSTLIYASVIMLIPAAGAGCGMDLVCPCKIHVKIQPSFNSVGQAKRHLHDG